MNPQRFEIIRTEFAADAEQLISVMAGFSAKWEKRADELRTLTLTPEQEAAMEAITIRIDAVMDQLN